MCVCNSYWELVGFFWTSPYYDCCDSNQEEGWRFAPLHSTPFHSTPLHSSPFLFCFSFLFSLLLMFEVLLQIQQRSWLYQNPVKLPSNEGWMNCSCISYPLERHNRKVWVFGIFIYVSFQHCWKHNLIFNMSIVKYWRC